MRRKLVMIGNGMAGMHAIEEILAIDADMYDITVFGAEPYPNYNRIRLAELLTGEATLPGLTLNDAAWYERAGITLHLGIPVTAIDREHEQVIAGGVTADYDRLILATGSQGEAQAALARIAQGRHPTIKLDVGDLVVFSSSNIPGNERIIAGLFNHIYRRGARVLHAGQAHLHVSGHAQAHELKTMLHLTRPKYFYPVHGEYRNLVEHKLLGRAVGISEQNIVIAENGQSVVVDGQGIRLGDNFAAGAVFVDGMNRDEIDDLVLRDRRVLAEDGIMTVMVVVNQHDGTLLGTPEMVAKGVLHQESEDKLNEAAEGLLTHLEQSGQEFLSDVDAAKEEIRIWTRRWCKKNLGRHPMVVPVVIEV